jgi:ribosomal protein S18 acetylase RimI-like enzyme
MVTLRPMTEAEFAVFKVFMYRDYAEAQARGAGMPVAEVADTARAQIDHLMQEGLRSPGQRYWKLVTQQGTAIGDLWVQIEAEKRHAFIYFVGVDASSRGQGYARQALCALDDVLRAHGVTRISLNVFGDNVIARHLYEGLGYQPAAILMRKDIHPGER